MILSAFALVFMSSAPPPSATAGTESKGVSLAERFVGREEARIPFTRTIRNFQTVREDSDDVVYLEAGRKDWYRAELSCFGIQDVRDAHAIVPLDRGFGLDRFSRIAFFGLSHRDRNECSVQSLVKVTPDEAIELKLERAPKAK